MISPIPHMATVANRGKKPVQTDSKRTKSVMNWLNRPVRHGSNWFRYGLARFYTGSDRYKYFFLLFKWSRTIFKDRIVPADHRSGSIRPELAGSAVLVIYHEGSDRDKIHGSVCLLERGLYAIFSNDVYKKLSMFHYFHYCIPSFPKNSENSCTLYP